MFFTHRIIKDTNAYYLRHYQSAFTIIMSDKRRKYYIVILLCSKMDEGA
jgi:hypothetical protein